MSSAIKLPYKICENNINNCDQAIQCALWDSWVHIKFTNLNYTFSKFLLNSNDPWFCISWCSEFYLSILWKIKYLPPISMIGTTNLKRLMTKTALYYWNL